MIRNATGQENVDLFQMVNFTYILKEMVYARTRKDFEEIAGMISRYKFDEAQNDVLYDYLRNRMVRCDIDIYEIFGKIS